MSSLIVVVAASDVDGTGKSAAWSTDGITWTETTSMPTFTSGAAQTWTAVCFSPDKNLFCAVGSGGSNNNNAVATSSDGATWVGGNLTGTVAWRAVCWAGGTIQLFVAVGDGGHIATSPDGVTWTNRTSAFTDNLAGVAYSHSLGLVCIVASPASAAHLFQTSTDAISWTARSQATTYSNISSGSMPTSGNYTDICWEPTLGKFFADISNFGEFAQMSSDGISWTGFNHNSNFGSIRCGRPWFNGGSGGFIEAGHSGNVTVNATGTTAFTAKASTASGNDVGDVLYDTNLSLYIMCEFGSGKVNRSTDMTAWTATTIGSGNQWSAIASQNAYGNPPAAPTGPTGVWASTEATDAFAAIGIGPTSGTWSSSENTDSWATSGGFTRFGIDTSFNLLGAGGDISTNFPNEIIVAIVAGMSVGGTFVNYTISSPNLTWNRHLIADAGENPGLNNSNMEMWWAYAHNKLTNEPLAVTHDAGATITTGDFIVFSIKGMNGNYNYPFDTSTQLAWGANIGGWGSSTQDVKANLPYATGPTGTLVTTHTKFAETNGNVSLSNFDLTATSTGTAGTTDNWVAGALGDALGGGVAYFEAEVVALGTGHFSFGVVPSIAVSIPIIGLAPTHPLGATVSHDGTIKVNGNSVGSLDVVMSNHDYIACAVNAGLNRIWFKNLTSGNHLWNNSAVADPHLGTGGFDLGATPAGSIPTVPNINHLPVSGTGGAPSFASGFIPYAVVDGTGTEWIFNFGDQTFVGTQPTSYSGWPGASSASPTHEPWPFITVIGVSSVTATPTFDDVTGFPGFTTLGLEDNTGSQGDLALGVSIEQGNQSVLVNDNVVFDAGVSSSSWIMMYDTIVPGFINPGSWESVEAADTMHAVGFPGGDGEIGFFTPVGTPDTFAAVGTVAVVAHLLGFEAPDSFSAFGFQPIRSTWASTEAADRFSAVGNGIGVNGVWASTEAADTFAALIVMPVSGVWASTETADHFAAFGPDVTPTKSAGIQFFVT